MSGVISKPLRRRCHASIGGAGCGLSCCATSGVICKSLSVVSSLPTGPFSGSDVSGTSGVSIGAFKSTIGANSVPSSACSWECSVTEVQPTSLRLISRRHR